MRMTIAERLQISYEKKICDFSSQLRDNAVCLCLISHHICERMCDLSSQLRDNAVLFVCFLCSFLFFFLFEFA